MKPSLLLFLPVACMFFSFASQKKRTRVVFFGDSITEFGVRADGYIAQMQDSLRAPKMDSKMELIGAGVSGNKIYDLYLRLESDVLERKPTLSSSMWASMMSGTNKPLVLVRMPTNSKSSTRR